MVNTPIGVKFHGAVITRILKKVFYREVSEKDRMRIFDAWSIHPDALKKITSLGVDGLHYRSGNAHYYISLEDAKKKGFLREFGGGKTFYIPIKFWDNGQAKML